MIFISLLVKRIEHGYVGPGLTSIDRAIEVSRPIGSHAVPVHGQSGRIGKPYLLIQEVARAGMIALQGVGLQLRPELSEAIRCEQ